MNKVEQGLYDFLVDALMKGVMLYVDGRFRWGSYNNEHINALDEYRATLEFADWNPIWDKALEAYNKIKNSPLSQALA